MNITTKDVPETNFRNMIGPIGWVVSPYGHFLRNPDFHIKLPSNSAEWSIPVFLGQAYDNAKE